MVVSAATRDRVGDRWRWQELPPAEVRGHPEPIVTHAPRVLALGIAQ
jgi:class 3 adenylate cyclase